MAQLKIHLEVCEEWNNYFWKNGARYCKKHLLKQAGLAKEEGREEAAKQILDIIKCKHDQSFWHCLSYVFRKTKGGRPTTVQVEGPNDSVGEHVAQPSVQEAKWSNIHYKRFCLAKEAPICKGKLCGEFGYNATSPTAWAILDGTYEYPNNFDKATKELCQECAIIRQSIPRDSIDIKITRENHHTHWQWAKEETSSSCSGLRFGHYKAGSLSDYINHFRALKATLLLHHRLVLGRWAQGLSVMLHKCLDALSLPNYDPSYSWRQTSIVLISKSTAS